MNHKKYMNHLYPFNSTCKKTILRWPTTRSAFVLALLLFFVSNPIIRIQAQKVSSLEKRISISFNGDNLTTALKKLEKQAKLSFSYSDTSYKTDKKVTNRFTNVAVQSILESLFEDYQVTLRERGSTILIKIQDAPQNRPSASIQTGNINGVVVDQFGESLGFATVALKGTQKGVFTNINGSFRINKIPVGKQILQVSNIGYESADVEVSVKADQTTRIRIELQESVSQLEEVVVEAETEKEKLERSAQAIRVIETREVKLQTADLGKVLASTEGVNVRRAGGLGSNTVFSLNGLQGEQVRFFLDGIPLDFIGNIGGVANVPVNLVERAEIYKGVVPIRFGADALGGAVNLVSKQSSKEKGGGFSYQYGSFNTHRATADFQYRPDASKLYVSGNAFYDFSKNNYEVDVTIADENFQTVPVTVERFHDDYEALGVFLKTGLHDLKWADNISIQGFYSDFFREIQNDVFMERVFGEPVINYKVYGGLINWIKRWKKVSIDFSSGYSYD
ncbi:MAG: carboxypeptidase-like regulatory domain-containing protein [Bacteroidota bacterium]